MWQVGEVRVRLGECQVNGLDSLGECADWVEERVNFVQ